MKKSRHMRQIASIVLLAATTTLFAYYISRHPEYIRELAHTDPRAALTVIGINFALIFVLAGIYYYTVQLAGIRIEHKENFLLTIYSSIANFFGPLQSGPGVRALYLKQKRGVKLRNYTLATLIYYAVYAVINAVLLLIGTRPWWETLMAAVVVAGISFGVLYWAKRRKKVGQNISSTPVKFPVRVLILMSVLTLAQVMLVTVRYYSELKATNASVSLGQAASYTGAANFALFASITPDGVGIREAFLVFSQKIHGVSTKEIVSANMLDRASYLVFLGLLFLVALSLHAKEFVIKKQHSDSIKTET